MCVGLAPPPNKNPNPLQKRQQQQTNVLPASEMKDLQQDEL